MNHNGVFSMSLLPKLANLNAKNIYYLSNDTYVEHLCFLWSEIR